MYIIKGLITIKQIIPYNFIKTLDELGQEQNSGTLKQNQKKLMDPSQHQLKFIFQKHKIEFIKKLGSGGFGSVYLGNSISQEFLPLAIKCITRKQLNKKPSLEKYLSQEINTMYSLKHTNIVKLLKTFAESQCIFLVMEYCEFGNLYSYQFSFPQKVFKYSEACNIFVQILRGLKAIHQENIIHRDLKCENILLKRIPKTNNYICKIGDFGFAKQLSETAKSQCGTPNFMAPQILSEKPYDKCVDIWSIGVILYYMLFGDYPFKGLNLLNDIQNKCSEGYDLLNHINTQIVKKKNKSLGDKELQILRNFFSKIFVIDPTKRISIIQMSKHPLFKECQVFIQQQNESTQSSESIQDQKLSSLKKVEFVEMVQQSIRSMNILSPQNTILMSYYFSKVCMWIFSISLKEIQFSEDKQFKGIYLKKAEIRLQQYKRYKQQLEKLISSRFKFEIGITTTQLNSSYQKFQFFKDHYRIFLGFIFTQVHNLALKDKQRLKIKVLCCHTINRVFEDSNAKYFQFFNNWQKQSKNKNKLVFDYQNFNKWIETDQQENISKTISAINDFFYSKK